MATLEKASVVFISLILIALVAISGYVYSRIRALSIPISDAAPILGFLLPIYSAYIFRRLLTSLGHFIPTSSFSRASTSTSSRSTISPLLTQLLLLVGQFLEAIIAVLSISYLASPSLQSCALETRWIQLYSSKNANAIRSIQDEFNCCGLRSLRDHAWPFKGGKNDDGACVATFGRTISCFGPWRAAERRYAGVLLGISSVLFGLKILIIIYAFSTRGSGPAWKRRGSWQDTVRRLVGWDDEQNRLRSALGSSRLINDGRDRVEPEEDSYADETNEQDPSSSGRSRVQPSELNNAGGSEWRSSPGL